VDVRIFRLHVDKDEIVRRVQSPERKLDFNPTVDEVQAVRWMNDNPIQDHPDEITIDNAIPVDEVVGKIKTVL
jgi:hypothetical protein